MSEQPRSTMASKIVVIGDINGRFSEVFEKLAKLHAKQSFAFAVVAGNLFAEPETASESDSPELLKLLQGTIEVPLPTYFALGNRDLPASVREKLAGDGEVCPNLSLLGRKVFIKTSEGFKVAAIGGKHVHSTDDSIDPASAVYSDRDVESALEFRQADLLFTSDWPESITAGSRANYAGSSAPLTGVQSLGGLCTALKPRYYFSTSEKYFEREPFFHNTPSSPSVTRFISLAPFGNPDKQKWIYAFSLEPSAPPPANLDGCTASPFREVRKRKAEAEEAPNGNGYTDRYRPDREQYQRKRHRPPPPPKTPQECYFCLANPSCETHMIGSIGTDAYMTIAKGPLSMRDTFKDLGFPGHMLIITLPHEPTIAAIADEPSRKSTQAEILQYKEALQTMVSAKSTGADGTARLGAVSWEISRAGGVHLHWQFLPMPAEMVEDGRVEAGFDVEAGNLSYPSFAKTAAALAEAEAGDYFKVMMWTENKQRDIVLPLDRSFRFDLQFGRRVLGKLLGLEHRTNWRDCEQTQAEESVDAEAFKRAFKQYDFSL